MQERFTRKPKEARQIAHPKVSIMPIKIKDNVNQFILFDVAFIVLLAIRLILT